ncbi:MAG: hypothetical protein AAFP77_23750 [Bacteroidota bacterium]
MAARKNEYRLEQSSPVGHAGFESFKSAEDQLYYFHINNENGQPLLFSRGYPTAKERTSVRNTARQILSDGSTLKRLGNKRAFYFTLSNSSGKELARSKNFPDRQSRNAAFDVLLTLQSAALSDTKTKKKQGGGQRTVSAPVSPADESSGQQSVLPSRFRYNLIFRRMEEGQPLVGEMEYPILKERTTFQGVDPQAIMAFITKHLPDDTATVNPETFKKQEQLEREITRQLGLQQQLQADLTAAQQQRTALTKAHEAELVQERKIAEGRAIDLLEKLEQTKAAMQGEIQRLSLTLEKERSSAKKQLGQLQQERAALQTQLKLELEQKAQLQAIFEEQVAPQAAKSMPSTPQPATEQPTASRPTPDKAIRPAASESVQKNIALFANGNNAGKIVNLNAIKSACLQMTIRQLAEQHALESFKADVYIKSLEDNRRLTLVKNHYGTLGLDNQNLTVPIALHTLGPGTYRFNLSVSSVQPPFNRSSPKYEGNTIVQVV